MDRCCAAHDFATRGAVGSTDFGSKVKGPVNQLVKSEQANGLKQCLYFAQGKNLETSTIDSETRDSDA